MLPIFCFLRFFFTFFRAFLVIFLFFFKKNSLHSGRSKVTRVTVGHDKDQPTKVFEFVKLIQHLDADFTWLGQRYGRNDQSAVSTQMGSP